MPQTTVLIPTYNCAKYISEALYSVLAQNYKDFEILIIDDGSTDDTENVVKEIQDSRIIYLKNDQNQGIVKTLNRGIQLAKGKYIARMDADDIMLGDRLQLQVDFLEQNPDYGMVGGWYQTMDEEGKLRSKIPLQASHDLIKIGLLFRNQFAHPAVTMRTHLLKKLKYQQKYIYCEDYDLWCRFAEVSKATNLPYYFLSYRWYSDNSCHRKQKELRKSLAELMGRELDKLNITYSSDELKMQMIINFNIGHKLFASLEKQKQLERWLEKVFNSKELQNKFDQQVLYTFQQTLLPAFCGVRNLYKKNLVHQNSAEKVKTYVINLAERQDRKAHVLTQFKDKPEFDLTIVKAIQDPVGNVGLWKTMRKIVQEAKAQNVDYILICEDDHQFTKAYQKENLFFQINEAQKQTAHILLGGVSGGFNYALPLSQDRVWLDIYYGNIS